MMVPAHAVHVSVSVPVLVSGPQIPCFKFTCQAKGNQKLHNRISKLGSFLVQGRLWIIKEVSQLWKSPSSNTLAGARQALERKIKMWDLSASCSAITADRHLTVDFHISNSVCKSNQIIFYSDTEKIQCLTRKKQCWPTQIAHPVCAFVCVSHSWIRKATARVERRQQTQAQVFGHVQELILVPLHVLTSLFQHHSHRVPSQKAAEHRKSMFYSSSVQVDSHCALWMPWTKH